MGRLFSKKLFLMLSLVSVTAYAASTYIPNLSSNLLKLKGSTSGAITMVANAVTTNHTITWPAANATGVLTNNGSGTLTWASSSGGPVAGYYGGWTALSASGISNCYYGSSSTQTFTNLVATGALGGSGCPTPTADTSTFATAAGVTVTASTTTKPELTAASLPAGEYEVVVNISIIVGDASTIRCMFTVSDGTTHDGTQGRAVGSTPATQGDSIVLIARFNYSSSGTRVFNLQGASAGTNQGCYAAINNVNSDLTMHLYRIN